MVKLTLRQVNRALLGRQCHNPNRHDSGQSTSWNHPQVWDFTGQF